MAAQYNSYKGVLTAITWAIAIDPLFTLELGFEYIINPSPVIAKKRRCHPGSRLIEIEKDNRKIER